VTSTPASEPFRPAGAAVPAPAAAFFLGVGLVLVGVYFLVPSRAQDVLYVVVGAGAVAAVAGAAARRAAARAAWTFFAVGLALAVGGDAVSGYYELHLNREPPVPSVADVLYLAEYPFLLVGIFLLLREFGAVRTRIALLDAAIVTAAAGLVQWVFFVDPYLSTHLDGSERAVDIAYPTLDLMLFVGIAQLLFSTGGRIVAYRLLLAAVALWIVGDEIFGLSVDDYTAGGWVDAFWLVSYVLWGTAALDPSAGAAVVRDRREVPRLTKSRLALLASALVTPPVVLLVEHFRRGRPLEPVDLAVGGTIVALLVVVRFAGLVRAVEGARTAERAANVRLRELDRLKDEFVATVSHELRTPLTSIIGYVELAREQVDGDAREYLQTVERNTARLLSLVNDLLLVARIQSGRLDLELDRVDLATLVADCVASAQPSAARNRVDLRLDAAGEAVVRGDARRITQVVDNLLSNAIKFSPSGGPVDVAVGRRDGRVSVAVADRGIGIPVPERSRLFERFFRSQPALERQIPGTGLGLFISKAIVEALGGTIAARAGEEGGTVFTVELPADE